MKRLHIKSKKGFTIIEVVLVLAIAGLIFMMVFLAVPALQRSQRDTQRSNDMARLVTALQNYSANNRGAVPTEGTKVIGGTKQEEITVGSTKCTTDGGPCKKTENWGYFYSKYLLVGSAGATDTFADPDGEPYGLLITKCSSKDLSAGEACTLKNAKRLSINFDQQSEGISDVPHAISIVKNATCQGENAVYSSGARKLAVIYKKEGGGVICVNN